MTSSQTVVAEGITKSHAGRRAVNSASLSVARGEVVGIAGSNGAGKSTFGRILAGFTRPDSGAVKLCGSDAMEYRRHNGIGFLPEETSRDWGTATLHDVITLCAPRGVQLHLDAIVEVLRLVPILGRRVADVSKGQWRAALAAAALIRRPAFVLLDEPDAGLDPLALVQLGEAMRMTTGQGSSIVMLSHHLDAMARVADRILFMRDGRIVAELRREVTGFAAVQERYAACMREASCASS